MDNRGVTSYQSCNMYNRKLNETTTWDGNDNETTSIPNTIEFKQTDPNNVFFY